MMKPAGCAHAADHGKRLVIKIGSSTLTTSESKIDYGYLAAVAAQIAEAKEAGWHPVVVTSAAIACGLAKGLPMEEAVRAAKAYVHGALASGLDLGKGSGPLDQMWE